MLVCLSANFQDFSFQDLSKFCFQAERLQDQIKTWRKNVDEFFILQTCNRVEIYFVSTKWLSPQYFWNDLPLELLNRVKIFRQHFAADHFLKVACSLESLAIGETHILGQIKKSYEDFATRELLGPILHRLIQKSFHTLKLVRNHTDLFHHQVSLITLSLKYLPERGKVLLLGAGNMAAGFARTLSKKGLEISLLNRSKENAQRLAEEVGGKKVYSLEDLASLDLRQFDAVISCMTLVNPIITPEMLQDLSKPLVLVDLGLPSNIDQSCGFNRHVELVNLGKLKEESDLNLLKRSASVFEAEKIVYDQLLHFIKWYYGKSCYNPNRNKGQSSRTHASGIRFS